MDDHYLDNITKLTQQKQYPRLAISHVCVKFLRYSPPASKGICFPFIFIEGFVPGFKRNLFTLFVKGISAHQVTGFSLKLCVKFWWIQPNLPRISFHVDRVCIHMCYNSTSSHSTRILSRVEFWIGCPRFLTYLTKHAQESPKPWSCSRLEFVILSWTFLQLAWVNHTPKP